MALPRGVRDGPFLKFVGWDVPGDNVGQYFQDLNGQAKVDALKAASLRYRTQFFAFNSNGWAKSWTKIDRTAFVKANSTLYIRVEFPGWIYHPGLDSPGNNIENANATAAPSVVLAINQRANPFDTVAFNSNGWIKNKLAPPVPNPGFLAGYYVRD
ncbi:hypothetical protein BS47DRAFT_742153 [Hydnum rufescens UP504]|uniref:Uncharacterized protein n=1 Tax=Hydnum rufescens UP504 TaxID=1448309 RepID=A0A9P6DUU1_9AGAM|nr:hypothetical protein BS47DRAFT_742153 [Hydnum rufescens UP504]